MSPEFKLLFVAVFSRFYYLASLVICPCGMSRSLVDTGSMFKFLLSLDTFHLYNVAKNGYLTEHTTAFFPLYPHLIRSISQLTGISILSVGVLFSNLYLVLSSIILYKLSIQHMSPNHAYLSCIFFLFNPASIIYSSMYTESLFTLLFLMAMHSYAKGRRISVTIHLTLALLCRLNALLFIVFVNYMYWPVILLPVSLYQIYYLAMTSFKKCKFTPYIPYSRVQSVYWNQGIFKFYTMPNIHNLLFGLPFIAYSMYILYLYIQQKGGKLVYFLRPFWGSKGMLSEKKLSMYGKKYHDRNSEPLHMIGKEKPYKSELEQPNESIVSCNDDISSKEECEDCPDVYSGQSHNTSSPNGLCTSPLPKIDY